MFICPLDTKLYFMATFTTQDYWNKIAPTGKFRGMDYNEYLSRGGLTDENFQHTYFDDDYLNEIEQYKDESWYDYLLTNPFLAGNNASFSPTFWQKMAQGLGDYSGVDSYNAELQSQRSQWLSEFVERMRQQDENSPTAQVARMNAAGINPDLSGNINSGAAAENDQPISPIQMHQPGQNPISGIGDLATSLLSNIMGLAQSFQSLKMNNLNLVAQELSNDDSAIDLVVKTIAGQSHFKSIDDIDSIPAEELGDLVLSASQKFDYSRYSPKTRKLVKSLFGQYSRDKKSGKYPLAVESLRAELRNRYASNTKSAVSSASSPLFSEDFDEFLKEYSRIIGKAEYDSYLIELKARNSKNNYDSSYFHNLDPKNQATAENDVANSRSVMAKQQHLTEGLYTELYQLFKDSKSWYGYAGLLLLPLVRGLVQNMGFGFGRYGKSGKFGFTGINF